MDLTEANVKRLVEKSTGHKLLKMRPLKGGHINSLFELTLDHSEPLILRVFQNAWKAQKEEYLYARLAAETDVPIPKVICAGDEKSLLKLPFILLSKVPGEHLDSAYQQSKDLGLFKQAGAILAKIHSIKFEKFGWIVGEEIKPSFRRWEDFAYYDLGYKLGQLRFCAQVRALRTDVLNYFDTHRNLLEIKHKPCLLHKDFTAHHLLSNGRKIEGVIDWEWATAGHSELDFTKLERWLFPLFPGSRDAFFRGYNEFGSVSPSYESRRQLYQLWHNVNLVNIAFETQDKPQLASAINELKTCLKEC